VTEVRCATESVSCVGLARCQHSAAAHLLLSAQWLCLLHSNSANTKGFIYVATTTQQHNGYSKQMHVV